MSLFTISGSPVCPIGIGTWMMGGNFDETTRISTPNLENDDVEIDAIRYALDLGQNHIDTAEMYGGGHTDEIVGKAIIDYNREDIYIADKLWKNSFGQVQTLDSIETMLFRLDTDYIDLLYIHSTFGDSNWENSIDPINELIDKGKVRHFGVSNFSIQDMERALKLSNYKISANQVHFNCGFKSEANDEFISFCGENDIDIVAYRPVERGDLLSNPSLLEVAEKHASSPSQVAIAWLVQRGVHAIPKASKKVHLEENFAALKLELDEEDFKILDAI